MKRTEYLAPVAESMEFDFREAILAASDENMNTENIGTTSGNW